MTNNGYCYVLGDLKSSLEYQAKILLASSGGKVSYSAEGL
jgi:hypothetical protein